jgi:hypothetical protein
MKQTMFATARTLVLAGAAVAVAAPVLGAEKGTWRGLAGMYDTAAESGEVVGDEGHAIMWGTMDGVVFNDNGGAFLDKARYQVVWHADTAEVGICYKTFTASDGSRAIARCQDTEANHPVYKGTWEFIKGTGRFEGITGKGTYELTYIGEKTSWDVLEGNYEIP